MVNEKYKKMLSGKSVIRELSEYATARGREIGYENVFDFSLGNPSVPCPASYTEAVIKMYKEKDPMALHGYSPSPGNYGVREAVAKSLRERFGLPYETKHIFMSSGAAGAIAHAIRLVTQPKDEVIGFAPFFPEYRPYVNDSGAELKVVPARFSDFQINFDAFLEMLNPKVQAVLINTPNNPSGVVYTKETLTRLSDILREKEKEYGHEIFLISDEPYREIIFDGKAYEYPSKYYENTISCYSFSKSLSLPGERIGYVAVNPAAKDADILADMCTQISRGIGHNCPASTAQLAVAEVLDEVSDISVYETNRNLLYDAFTRLGFETVKPDGTFYILVKALEEDAVIFCNKAKDYDLIFVPADNFGAAGYFRVAYCIDTEKVERAIFVLEKFVEEIYK